MPNKCPSHLEIIILQLQQSDLQKAQCTLLNGCYAKWKAYVFIGQKFA